jgi:quinol monooxygenase YgiN
MTDQKPTQDETALRMMAEHADKVVPDKAARERASEELLEELLALDGAYGFQVSRDKKDPNSVLIFLQHQSARVTAMRGGKFRIAQDEMSPAQDVTGLEFDRVSNRLVSTRDDDRYEPKFMEPRTRRRTAVAEVMYQVLRLMASDR